MNELKMVSHPWGRQEIALVVASAALLITAVTVVALTQLMAHGILPLRTPLTSLQWNLLGISGGLPLFASVGLAKWTQSRLHEFNQYNRKFVIIPINHTITNHVQLELEFDFKERHILIKDDVLHIYHKR